MLFKPFCQAIGPEREKSTFLMKTKVDPSKIMCRMHQFSGPGDLYLMISWISQFSRVGGRGRRRLTWISPSPHSNAPRKKTCR